MKLFNFDGAAIFGPGSEWLWFMAQFAALSITGLAIYRQLHAQRFANELGYRKSVDDEWMSERMVRLRLAAMLDLARGRPDLTFAMQRVGDLLNEVAWHQNHNLLESKLTWELGGMVMQRWWWGMAVPRIAEARRETPNRWQDWEQLAMAMRERDLRAGAPLNLSVEFLNGPLLRKGIAEQIEGLRLEQEMRAGVIPDWPIPETAADGR